MGFWVDPPVFIRDFAYPPCALLSRMANENVGDSTATTFAEYVDDLTPSPDDAPAVPSTPDANDGDAPLSQELAPERPASAPASTAPDFMHPRRPHLSHRIHSHRLRVQANAYMQRARLLSGPLVTFTVGESQRRWTLHLNLLCHHSPYIVKEFKPKEEENSEQRQLRLDLPDDDPSGFELLVKWLYQGKIEDVSVMTGAHRKYNYAVSCHKLYLLCDRFEMPQLKNIAMDQYRKGLFEARLVPDAEEINQIYRRSRAGSPFRQLMTKIAARQIMDPDSDKDAESYRDCFDTNPEFAIDLVNAIKRSTEGMLFDDPTEGDDCFYHDHRESSNCSTKSGDRSGPPSTPTRRYPQEDSATTTNTTEQQKVGAGTTAPVSFPLSPPTSQPGSPSRSPPRIRRDSPAGGNRALDAVQLHSNGSPTRKVAAARPASFPPRTPLASHPKEPTTPSSIRSPGGASRGGGSPGTPKRQPPKLKKRGSPN